MEPLSVPRILNMILEFMYFLSDWVYKALFYEVTWFGTSFPLWQLFSVIGVGVVIIAIIIKILL